MAARDTVARNNARRALNTINGIPLSADIGVNGEDVAIFGPSTTHGYDTFTGAIRTMPFARRTWNPQFFKTIPVSAGNTTIVTSSENYNVSDYSKIRLFAKASGTGNIDVVLRVSLNGGYDYVAANTFSMGDGVSSILTPIVEIAAPIIKIGLFNKSANAQSVDVWGFLY
nr:hypothetical protein [Paenibacillus xylanexedens]